MIRPPPIEETIHAALPHPRFRGRRDRPPRPPLGLRGRSELRAARCPDPVCVPLLRGRGGGPVDRRRPVVGRRQGPAAAGPHPRGDRQQPRPADGHGPRGRGPRPVRHRQVVPLPRGRRRCVLHGQGVLEAVGPAGDRGRRPDAGELERQPPALLGDRPLRPHQTRQGVCVRRVPRHRGGAARGRPDGRRGRGLRLPVPPGAGPATGGRAAHRPDERGDRRLLREPGARRRLQPARARPRGRQPGPHGRGDPSAGAADRGHGERGLARARAAPRPDRARSGSHRAARSPGDPGGPPRRPPRAAPRRPRRRAAARGRERRRRRG